MPEEAAGVRETQSRNIYAFGITSLLNDTASEMAYWVLPAFLASIGAGPAQLGIIEGVAESVASFAKLFSGYLADRVTRRKPLVVSGYLIANAVKPILAIVTSWWQVLGIRFADRLSKGIRNTPRDVMATESAPEEKIGSAFGLIQAMDSAGAVIGPLLALLLIPHYGMRGVFWFAAIPGFLCITVAILGIRETRRKRSDARAAQPAEKKNGPPAKAVAESRAAAKLRFPASFYLVLVAVTIFSLGNSSDMFLVLRAEDVGIAAAYAPLLGLVFNITYTAFSWPAGSLSDRVSRKGMAAAGYLVFAIVYVVFAAAPSRPAIWIAMAFYGLFYALTNPVLKALVVDTVVPEVRGRALGVYFFVTSLAVLLASIVTGELWKSFGPRVPFYLSAGTAALAAGLLLLCPGQRRESERTRAEVAL